MESSNIVLVLLFFILSSFQVFLVTCTQFRVGDMNGWKVPKSNDQEMYNNWASKQRFKVDDTVYFHYKENTDSVMVVTAEEYKKCHSEHAIFVSTDGYTVVILDRPGLFYFISGVAGHCERGQKIIVKVLETANPPKPPPNNNQNNATNDSSKGHNNNNGASVSALLAPIAISSTTLILCIISFLSLFLF